MSESKLVEIVHLAAKNATKALSKLSGEVVYVEVSKIEITKARLGFPSIASESMVAGIYLPVTGEITGASLLVFPEKIAYDLCDLLVRREPGTTQVLTEMDKSALKEVGNIICGSFLTVLSNALEIKIIEHVPDFNFDQFGAVVDQIVAKFSLKTGDALVLEVKFIFENTPVNGYVVLLFGLEEMQAIINALNEESVP